MNRNEMTKETMKTIRLLKHSMKSLFMVLLPLCLISCGGDDEPESTDNSYYLMFAGEDPQYDWDADSHSVPIRLKICLGDGVKLGDKWTLNCDEPWIELLDTWGQISDYEKNRREVKVSGSILEANRNYANREAKIEVFMPSGTLNRSSDAQVTIYQYGYEHYLDYFGTRMSFTTNLEKASDEHKVDIDFIFNEVVEIDWGDGKKEYIDDLMTYELARLYDNLWGIYEVSHYYASTGTYKVNLLFGGNEFNRDCTLIIPRNQGVESISYGQTKNRKVDASKRIRIAYDGKNLEYNVSMQ